MNTIESIFSRSSVRKFLSRPIDTAIVEKIIEAGAAAPSSKNKQPWRFVAVVSDEKKREMVAAINSGIERETRGDGLLP
ncbi:MAG: nitroreductase family protein, partial [Clostridiales Family XIII bacterium]|nr:nitroreductase family protein [Clostridiales Family XIII bacterium]